MFNAILNSTTGAVCSVVTWSADYAPPAGCHCVQVDSLPPSFDHQLDAQGAWFLPLEALRAAQWSSIKAAREVAENGTFIWRGHTLQASMARIGGASTAALAAQTLNVPYVDVWTLADNTTIPVNAQDILSMGMALVQHVSSCHAKARALRVLIDNATTPEEVASITWDTPT